MAGIRFDLSSPEAVERFRDLAVSLLEITGELTPDLYKKLEKKAEEFCVHKADFDETLWEIFKHDLSLPNKLGDMYFLGKGVEKDDSEAVKWYRKAAEQGHAGAQNNLGLMYYLGKGVGKDDSEAVKWFRKAEEQGDAFAQINLATPGYGLNFRSSAKIRIHELAKELGLENKDVIAKCKQLGFGDKNPSHGLENSEADSIRKAFKPREEALPEEMQIVVEKKVTLDDRELSVEERWVKSTVIRRRTKEIEVKPQVIESPRFTFLELTSMDNSTDLIWAKDANLAEEGLTWHDASKFIMHLNKFNYAGYNHWRLPYIKELEALVNFLKDDLYVDKFLAQKYIELGFINVKSNIYWSLTPAGNSGVRVLCANMKYGGISRQLESMKHYVWPVCNKN